MKQFYYYAIIRLPLLFVFVRPFPGGVPTLRTTVSPYVSQAESARLFKYASRMIAFLVCHNCLTLFENFHAFLNVTLFLGNEYFRKGKGHAGEESIKT